MVEGRPGKLYVVATPIGNLGDVTFRAAEILKRVAIVAAEDTRRSRVLLEHVGAHPERLVSLHDRNEADRSQMLLAELQRGHDVALVSDAGTPVVSDPGFVLVRECATRGIEVVAVPGPSALTAALSISPVPVDRFVFLGFLSARGARRTHALDRLRASDLTVVFFEAPHRLEATLRELGAVLGEERRVVLAKELTKLNERVLCGTAAELLARLVEQPELGRGEFVVIVEGSASTDAAIDPWRLMDTLLAELPPAQAARLGARLTGLARGELYAYALASRGRQPQGSAATPDDSR